MSIFNNKPQKNFTQLNSEGEHHQLSTPYEAGDSQIVHDVMREKRRLLSFFGKVRFSKEQSAQAEEQLVVLTTSILKAQNAHIQHQLGLGLDVVKKRDLMKYNSDIDKINKAIVEQSSKMARTLVELVFETQEKHIDLECKEIDRFRSLTDSGKISSQRFEQIQSKIYASSDAMQNSIQDMVNTIIERNLTTFADTVRLLKDTQINSL